MPAYECKGPFGASRLQELLGAYRKQEHTSASLCKCNVVYPHTGAYAHRGCIALDHRAAGPRGQRLATRFLAGIDEGRDTGSRVDFIIYKAGTGTWGSTGQHNGKGQHSHGFGAARHRQKWAVGKMSPASAGNSGGHRLGHAARQLTAGRPTGGTRETDVGNAPREREAQNKPRGSSGVNRRPPTEPRPVAVRQAKTKEDNWRSPPNVSLGVGALGQLVFVAEDGGDLALHEGPGHGGSHEWALLTAGTVHLAAAGRTLALDAVSGTRETELVLTHGRTLDKVRVLQPLLTQGALECGRRCRRGVRAGGRRRRRRYGTGVGIDGRHAARATWCVA